jgi:TPR repeat protein
MSEWLGEGVIAEVRRVIAEPTTDPAYLHDLCGELDNRVLHADLMIGILPMEALEVMAQGFAAAGTMGHQDAWVRLGRSYLGDRADTPVAWPSTYPFEDPDDEPAGAALRCFAEAARAGDRAAAYLLAATSRDGSEAARRYRAMYNVAAGYATGNGFPLDPAAAVVWYERAADAGNARVAATAGIMHLTGEGVPVDADRAERWFCYAEEEGFDVDGWLEQLDLTRRRDDAVGSDL